MNLIFLHNIRLNCNDMNITPFVRFVDRLARFFQSSLVSIRNGNLSTSFSNERYRSSLADALTLHVLSIQTFNGKEAVCRTGSCPRHQCYARE